MFIVELKVLLEVQKNEEVSEKHELVGNMSITMYVFHPKKKRKGS